MTTAMRIPGQRGANRRSATMIATVAIDTATATALNVGSAAASASSFGRMSAGFSGSRSPRKSPAWPMSRMTAMPEMNPTVTG